MSESNSSLDLALVPVIVISGFVLLFAILGLLYFLLTKGSDHCCPSATNILPNYEESGEENKSPSILSAFWH